MRLAELARTIREGELSPVEVVRDCLERIEARADLGAFITVTGERAVERAEAQDALRARGGAPSAREPLWGVPLADKDLVARAGVRTTYGSRGFADFVPEHSDPSAEAIDRTGAISVGKTNTPEFGMTGYTENAIAPPARNPWQPATGAGGSSGGAAVAVSARLLPAAPASDGGGSIRIPAATVGVVGLKPSRGRLPFANGLGSPGGLSVAGPIARSAEDAALLLDALAGGPYSYATRAPGTGDGHDSLVAAARSDAPPMRVGATLATPWDGWTDTALDPRALAAYERAIGMLGSAGHGVEEAGWRPRGYPEMFTTIWRASAAAIPVPDDELDARLEPFTAWLVREGRSLRTEGAIRGYQDATAFERETIAALSPFDAVLTPALALAPQQVGWHAEAATPLGNFERQCMYAPHTSFVNVCGLPAITVPIGDPDAPGERPWSVQLVGRPGGEAAIVALAAQLESARGPLPAPPGS